MEDTRVNEGVEMIQSIWYGAAIQIVNMAIRVYKLNPEQAKALKEVYLRPNDYCVRLRDF
jgi:hypothetical protein